MYLCKMWRALFFTTIFLCSYPVWAEYQLQQPVVASCSERTYAYVQDDIIHGISYEVVKAVFERADIPFQYRILPWARIYNYGLHRENFLVACLGKTPEREGRFQWVGAVNHKLSIYFYGLTSNAITVNSLEEMKQYKIGVLRGSYYEDFLIRNHFPRESIHAVSSTEQTLLMLTGRRFDFLLLEESTMSIIAKSLKIAADQYQKVLFAFHAEDYLAFSHNTSSALVERVRKAYQELAAEGVIQQIFIQEDQLKEGYHPEQ
ncbi:transporter substrate-binding domain-containing protein [Vibrio ruber]|uniref:substrate-binding periplasmic protein n=1 Tax=Vibrio ruber TaxID=184755 RepID=UPI002892C495|nr:transporter substrate-binding domain-containing protein [Vibrio ruber]WNJ95513.1 transporter substrate-binding domain-containing protein [Vibrio ruber]